LREKGEGRREKKKGEMENRESYCFFCLPNVWSLSNGLCDYFSFGKISNSEDKINDYSG